jgi:hypothetical protein
MSTPYNPASGADPPGEQPPWGGHTSGNYPQQDQPGYPAQPGYQPGGYGPPGYTPPGAQQGYQQGNYPQQQSGYGYSHGSDRGGYGRRRETVGIIGLIGAVIGAVLLILGFTALDWYNAQGDKLKVSDIHKSLNGTGAPAFPKAYFGWLGWVLLALVVVAAVLASLPIGSGALAFRIIAPIVGVAGIVITLLALNNFWDKVKEVNGGGDFGTFKHSAIGLYLTLAGFVVAGLAGVFGPRRA